MQLLPLLFVAASIITPKRGVFCFAVVSTSTRKKGCSEISKKIQSLSKRTDITKDAKRVVIIENPPRAGALSSSTLKDVESINENVGVWPCFDVLDKKILKVALPCIANFAINPLVGAVDLFWVGRMGNALAIAGQAAANQVFSSTFWIASYLPSVTATLVSKENAKGDIDGVQAAVCQALFVAFMISIPMTIFTLIRADTILSMVLDKSAPAKEFARPYLMIRGLSYFPAFISTISYSAFRGMLDTVTPLKISLLSNAFNAVLDPIMIFFFKMGVSGAAIATILAEIISAFTFTYCLLQRKLIRWSKLFRLPRWVTLKPLLLGGLALQLRNLSLQITFLSVARVTQAIDSTGVAAAAHSIAIQVFQVGGIVLLALSTVSQTLVPNEMVEKLNKKTGMKSGGVHAAKALVYRLMSWGLILGSTFGAIQILMLPLIHNITPIKEVQEVARVPSYIACILQVINGLVFIGEGVMIGCGNFLTLSLSTFVSTVGILVALQIFPKVYGLTGVWIGFGVFNVLRLCGVIIHQFWIGPFAPRNMHQSKNAAIAP